MGQAQINVRTRACSRTSIARTRQAALTHNVRGKELNVYGWVLVRTGARAYVCMHLCINVVTMSIMTCWDCVLAIKIIVSIKENPYCCVEIVSTAIHGLPDSKQVCKGFHFLRNWYIALHVPDCSSLDWLRPNRRLAARADAVIRRVYRTSHSSRAYPRCRSRRTPARFPSRWRRLSSTSRFRRRQVSTSAGRRRSRRATSSLWQSLHARRSYVRSHAQRQPRFTSIQPWTTRRRAA